MGDTKVKIAAPKSASKPGKVKVLPFYDIVVKDLTYRVPKKKKAPAEEPDKVLLNGINAEAYHGQILAIVGSSGAGKTTFLDALAGRIRRTSVEGDIFVNGERVDCSLKSISGYLMQDDALFPFLTVRETFLYSALLSLPSSMTLVDKNVRVDDMITQLGLEQCANTHVGNEKIRGVSGGERRRVSIGSDLIHDPAVMFLDEPTSGLDSRAALNVMENLHVMAQAGGRTALVTIHQPSYRMLDIIDRVLVLGKGNVIYHGPPSGLKNYFDPLGRSMPDGVNVIEYAIDILEDYESSPLGLAPLLDLHASSAILNTMERGRQRPSPRRLPPSSGSARTTSSPNRHHHPKSPARGSSTPMSPLSALTPTRIFKKKAAPEPMPGCLPGCRGHDDIIGGDYTVGYASSSLSECAVLFTRTLKNTSRTPDLFRTRLTVMSLIGVVFGTLFFRLKLNYLGGRSRVALFYFLVAPLIFSTIEALGVFMVERRIFIRERARRAYRVSSYVLSGMAVTVPFLLVLATILSCIVYFLVGLAPTIEAFFFFLLIVWLTLWMANSFVCFMSTMVPNFAVGNTITTTIVSYCFLFSGFFIPKDAIPPYWIWVHYLSLATYPYEAFVQNEFGSRVYKHVTWDGESTAEFIAYTDVSMAPLAKWFNAAIILLFALGFRVLMWASLKFFTTSTRK